MEKKLYKVFTLKLAKELVKRNFKIVDWELNLNQPKLKVFLFDDTESLHSEIRKINEKFKHV